MDINETANTTTTTTDAVSTSTATLPPRRRFRLRRSPTDVMMAGVCGGLAEELDLDPALVRIAMVILTIVTSGLAAVGYVAAWVLAPVEARS